MTLLLDTCTFLWVVAEPQKMSVHARQLFEAADNEVYLSAASGWEIARKYRARRLELSESPDHYVPLQRNLHGILPLAIDEESALHTVRLPELHRDPFDRIIVSQAIVHGMTILTPDPLISQYPARVVW